MKRPDGWSDIVGKISEEHCCIATDFFNGIEAGATAMHRADLEWIKEHDICSHIFTNTLTKVIEIYKEAWEEFAEVKEWKKLT